MADGLGPDGGIDGYEWGIDYLTRDWSCKAMGGEGVV